MPCRLFNGYRRPKHKLIWRVGRLRFKCDGTHAETIFILSAKRTSPFKSAGEGASVQSTTCSWGVLISGSNAGYTMFRGSVKCTGYPLHSPFSPSLPPASPCAITFQLDSQLFTSPHCVTRTEVMNLLANCVPNISIHTIWTNRMQYLLWIYFSS
jgi:hypothetical protein